MRGTIALATLTLSAGALVPPAWGEALDCPPQPNERVRVSEVIDGDTIALEDGRIVRLVGILAPKAELSGASEEERRFAKAAQEALARAVRGSDLGLATSGGRHDRHGRLLAHAFIAGDRHRWLQGLMIDQGLARAHAAVDNSRCVRVLLDREAVARAASRGLWAGPLGQVRAAEAPEELAEEVGRYAIVEGRVISVGERPQRTYLNFGTYWSEDFTAFVDRRDVQRFTDEGFVLGDLEGRRVRVRGWVGEDRGPVIHMKRPEQLELVGEE
ncbi:thermonuclease family protein [Microbaculum marinum]|uniref:Thermonuclease family protein n=1 Tax=Microbaculum marinum TaxID=1764581 RepID=A0AAW9RJ67_9HYPH